MKHSSFISRGVEAAGSAARRLTQTPLHRVSLAKKFLAILSLSMLMAAPQASACPFCYGAKDGKGTQHMAVAIWFLFGAVMTVLGGIGAFGFHIWRHGRMPAEPYQELNDEDLSRYE